MNFGENNMMNRLAISAIVILAMDFPSFAQAQTSFSYNGFAGETGLALCGNAEIFGNVLRVNPSAVWQRSAVYNSAKVSLQNGFETVFAFRISGVSASGIGGGDGFAFVIQNDSLDALGGPGGAMGYGDATYPTTYNGTPNSVAIEFDMFLNPENNDPSNNHVSVQSRGTQPNSPNHNYSLRSTSSIPTLNDGAIHFTKIAYASDSLKVYVDDMLTPALSVPINLSSELRLDNGSAWLGFTSGTGIAFETHDILTWQFSSSPAAFDNALIVASVPLGTELIALRWTPVADATKYKAYESTTSPTSGFTLTDTVAAGSGSLTVSGLTSNTPYFFKLSSVNAGGAESPTSNTTGSATFFSLSATPAPNNQAALSWQPVQSTEVYKIYTALPGDTANFALLDSTTSTSYTTTALQGNPYWVKVYAVGGSGRIINESNVVYSVPNSGGIAVTFQADATDLINTGFDPAEDTLEVLGDTYPLNWSTGAILTRDSSNMSLYSDTLTFYAASGSVINYKYRALPESRFENSGWEMGNNSAFIVASSDTVLEPRKPQIVTGVAKTKDKIPNTFALVQNYPNPFNPTTIIRYEIPKKAQVTLQVYNVLGELVRTLVNEVEQPGYYEVDFNASGLASGVYFYRIEAGKYSRAVKMLFLK